MTLQEWGALGEFVGGVAVIVTLVYLAVQTRQARRSAWADAPQWMSDGYRAWISAPRDDAELARLIVRGVASWDDLNPIEQLRVHSWWGEKVVSLDAIITLHAQGLIEDDRLKAWVDDCLSMIRTPGGAEWWARTKVVFTPQVRGELERRLAEPGTLPPPWTETLLFFRPGEGPGS